MSYTTKIKEEISMALAEQKTSEYSGINSRGREEVIEELASRKCFVLDSDLFSYNFLSLRISIA